MKNLFRFFTVAAAVMLAAACSKDEGINDVAKDGDFINVTFTAQLPGTAADTKASISDGTKAVDLYFEVYDQEKTKIAALRQVKKNAFSNLKAEVTVRLVKGQTYNFIFWAQDPECSAYTIDNLNEISVNYNGANSQDETRDAFFATLQDYKVTGAFEEPVTLRRPFAQLNIATTVEDYEAAKASGIEVLQSCVKVNGIASKLYTFTGAVEGDETVEFALADVPAEDLKDVYVGNENGEKANTSFKWLSMNYLLVAAEEKDLVEVNAVLKHNKGEIPVTVSNVPVQRNYRTNIIGDLLTSLGKFSIIIDPIYYLDDKNFPDALEDKLFFAAANGGEVTLTENVTLSQSLEVVANMVLNLNGYTITNKAENATTDVIVVREGAELVINGNGNVTAVSGNDGYPVYCQGKVTINGGTFTSGTDADNLSNACIYARNNGKVYINGGEFHAAENALMINKRDADRATTVIEIKGGKYYGFDPANNASENAGTNFVAPGYASYYNASDNSYTVRPLSGTITLSEATAITAGAHITESVTIDLNGQTLTAENSDILFRVQNGATLTFKGEGVVNTALYAASANVGGTVVVEGNIVFTCLTTCFQANGGKVYIRGGEFNVTDSDKRYMLNHIDSKKNIGLIEVSGGKFAGYNPAESHSENPVMNFVASGFQSADNGNGVYVVGVKTAIEKGETVTLAGNGTIGQTISIDGGTLNGNGHTLTVSESVSSNYLLSGQGNATVKNLTIAGENIKYGNGTKSTRALYFTNPGNIVIENVTVSGVGYALNVNSSKDNGSLVVNNSTLIGWTSFGSGIKSAHFTKVNFGIGSYFADAINNGLFRPYSTTVLDNCTFDAKYYISVEQLSADATLTLNNCYVGTTKVTKDNIATLLNIDGDSSNLEYVICK